MSVRVEHLDFHYGGLAALRDVSVTAGPGAIAAVLGPNAAGKSTLLRCLIGALRPAAGSVTVKDRRVDRLSPRQIAALLAYVPQRSTVFATFTVREVVALGRFALRHDDARIDDALSRMELLDVAGRSYAALSVGQQQRVTLARALAQLDPDGVLVLDEPMSAMDLAHVRDVTAHLRRVADGGVTVIIAMHDLPLAASMADHVWLLDDGAVARQGPAAEVMTPAVLEGVFGVGFEYVSRADGERCLTMR